MTRNRRRWPSALTLAVAMAATVPVTLRAQSVLDRTPNLSGAWVGEPGVVQFNFVHRFDKVGDKVLNSPTFLLGIPLPGRTLLGLHYASSSAVVLGKVNEFELLGRWAPLTTEADWPVDAGVTLAYNGAAKSVDGELAVTVPLRRLRILGAGRVLQDAFGTGDTRWGGGGGVTLRLHESLALSGDFMALTNRASDEHPAWSVGIQTRIPLTPHTFSLQATNARTGTLQGSSEVKGSDRTFYGFEFTIPFTLSRYFGHGGHAGDEGATAPPATGDVAAEVAMTNQLRFSPETVHIRVGQTVRWRNPTPLVHTVTADPAKAIKAEYVALPRGAEVFDSGNLGPGAVFEHTFTVPGEYRYFCVPHGPAGMVGRVIVER